MRYNVYYNATNVMYIVIIQHYYKAISHKIKSWHLSLVWRWQTAWAAPKYGVAHSLQHLASREAQRRICLADKRVLQLKDYKVMRKGPESYEPQYLAPTLGWRPATSQHPKREVC